MDEEHKARVQAHYDSHVKDLSTQEVRRRDAGGDMCGSPGRAKGAREFRLMVSLSRAAPHRP